jgi:hypothetical protein
MHSISHNYKEGASCPYRGGDSRSVRDSGRVWVRAAMSARDGDLQEPDSFAPGSGLRSLSFMLVVPMNKEAVERRVLAEGLEHFL